MCGLRVKDLEHKSDKEQRREPEKRRLRQILLLEVRVGLFLPGNK